MNTRTLTDLKVHLLAEAAKHDEKESLKVYYEERLKDLKAELKSGRISVEAAKVVLSVLRQSWRVLSA